MLIYRRLTLVILYILKILRRARDDGAKLFVSIFSQKRKSLFSNLGIQIEIVINFQFNDAGNIVSV